MFQNAEGKEEGKTSILEKKQKNPTLKYMQIYET